MTIIPEASVPLACPLCGSPDLSALCPDGARPVAVVRSLADEHREAVVDAAGSPAEPGIGGLCRECSWVATGGSWPRDLPPAHRRLDDEPAAVLRYAFLDGRTVDLEVLEIDGLDAARADVRVHIRGMRAAASLDAARLVIPAAPHVA
jgi:hypothetical protein